MHLFFDRFSPLRCVLTIRQFAHKNPQLIRRFLYFHFELRFFVRKQSMTITFVASKVPLPLLTYHKKQQHYL